MFYTIFCQIFTVCLIPYLNSVRNIYSYHNLAFIHKLTPNVFEITYIYRVQEWCCTNYYLNHIQVVFKNTIYS